VHPLAAAGARAHMTIKCYIIRTLRPRQLLLLLLLLLLSSVVWRIWYINFAARATRLVCNSPPENRSVIEPRPFDNIYLHLNEISAAAGPTRYNNNYYYYWDIVGIPF